MRPTSKPEMKLPTSANICENPSRKECSSTSPTIARESCSKSLWEERCHIFRVPPTIVAQQQQPSHNTNRMAMDHSLSSRNSSPSIVDRMNDSCSTIGLPSDYPLHRKNTSFSSVALEEELEDFDAFLDESISFEKRSLSNPLSSCGAETNSFGPWVTSGTTKNGPKKKRHRRMHSDLFSFDNLVDTTKLDQAHHRRHNYALGQNEFNESVLTELFEDVAIAEVRS